MCCVYDYAGNVIETHESTLETENTAPSANGGTRKIRPFNPRSSTFGRSEDWADLVAHPKFDWTLVRSVRFRGTSG